MRKGRLRMATALAVSVMVVLVASCSRSDPTASAAHGSSSAATTVAAYLVPWDSRSIVGARGGVLSEVNPVWFQPTRSGSIVYTTDTKESSTAVATVAADAAAQGVVLAPSISNFVNNRWDGALVAALIASPARRERHIAAITELVRSNHWSSIDIDYESLPATSRAAFSAFITELAAALHRIPAKLSVTVHAKTSEPGDWSGAQAQDWRAIGAGADQVRVMAYDFSEPSTPPGPIAPVSWVAHVLRLARTEIPRNRISLGLPTYGYDWRSGAPAAEVQWTDANALARAHKVMPQWDSASASPWFQYRDDQGRKHTVWYEDARSLQAKLDVARKDGVTAVVLWRLGGEDPAIWPVLRGQR